jgi:hypothetical protein
VRRVFSDGRVSDPVTAADVDVARASGFPRMALGAGNRLFVAWTVVAGGRAAGVRLASAELARLP